MGLDPDDPVPAALAGWCHAQIVLYYDTPEPAEERARAVRLAERAAALDGPPGDPLVLTARGGVALMVGERHDADTLGARALAMDPGSAWAWERSAWLRCNSGEAESAIREFGRALHLKGPRRPTTNCLAGIGCSHLAAGRHAEAVPWFRRALLENPNAAWLHRFLGPCHLRLGDLPAARASLDRLRHAYPAVTAKAIVGALPRVDDGRKREVYARMSEDLARLGLGA
jgi:tetratricopeptide (TPR) repeat protein